MERPIRTIMCWKNEAVAFCLDIMESVLLKKSKQDKLNGSIWIYFCKNLEKVQKSAEYQ